jgi:hypothetical protein
LDSGGKAGPEFQEYWARNDADDNLSLLARTHFNTESLVASGTQSNEVLFLLKCTKGKGM